MIIAGFIWLNSKKNPQQITKLLDRNSSLITKAQKIDNKHLTLFASKISEKNDKDEIISDDKAIAIGRVFHQQSHQPLTRSSLECLSRNDANSITEQYWGKYIYISWRDSSEHHINILRDPTGQLPFFYHTLEDGNVIFSSQLQVIQAFLAKYLQLNWDYLTSYLLQGATNSTATPFAEIKELPPGCRLTMFDNKCQLTPSWQPANFYQPSRKKTDLNDSIIKVLKNSLKSWVNDYEDIYINLNASTESLATLYTLNSVLEPYQRLTAIAYQSSTTKTKEHLEKVCNELGVSLLSFNAISTLPFAKAKQPQLKPNRPQNDLIYQGKYNFFQELTNSSFPSLLINNHASRAFMPTPTIDSIFDYFIEKGLFGCSNKISGLAQHSGLSTLSISKNNLTNVAHFLPFSRKRSSFIQPIYPNWLNKIETKKYNLVAKHPVYQSLATKVLPGKFQHLDSICSAMPTSYVEPLSQLNPSFSPFQYQPMLELAISIPSYDLYNKEHTQLPCKRAINKAFNTSLIWHESEENTDALLLAGLKGNLDYVKQLCLEGQFAKQGLVDRDSLEQTFAMLLEGSADGHLTTLASIVNLVSAEMFLQCWG